MKSRKSLWMGGISLLITLLLVVLVLSALEVLTGDSITSSLTITTPSNALGTFDTNTATIAGWKGGDTATWTISNRTSSGTITEVKFTVMMSTSGTWGDDTIAIQYSNDSGTGWTNAVSGITVAGSLTPYGNYTVTTSFPSTQSLDDMQVRILYTQSKGSDGITFNLDGVEVYVTYADADNIFPNVTLAYPLNYTFVSSKTVDFNFTPDDDIGFSNCTLYINESLNQTNTSPIINHQNNTILETFGEDGDYLWNVTCSDTSGNANFSSVAWIVRIDTTVPNVSLMGPPNHSVELSVLVEFVYTVSDAANITSCELVANDITRDTDPTIIKYQRQSFNVTLPNGDYLWYVNCTDENGWEGQSEIRNVSIQVSGPTILASTSPFFQGDTVFYAGENWQNDSTVGINVTLSNGTNESFFAIANESFEINFTQFLNYSHPVGLYTVYALQLNDSGYNASTSFTVNARVVTLTTDKNPYIQGEIVNITGLGFSPGGLINLTISEPGSTINQTDIIVNNTGGFYFEYFTNETHPVGIHNITASDYTFPNLNASASFTINERMPMVITNKSTYQINETVGIDGTYFSSVATILLTIYDTLTDKIDIDFPTTVYADSEGTFNYSWAINNTCSGNYTVLAEDQNITSFKANTTFLIWNKFNVSVSQVVDSITGNRITPTLPPVQTIGGTTQSVGMSATVTDGYLEFGFSPGIPANASFNAINITIIHQRTSTKVDNFQMYIVKNGVLSALIGAGCSGAPPDTLGATTCDITSYVNNVSVANNLYIRVNYTSSGGGPRDVLVDFAETNYSWTGDPIGCFNMGDIPVAPYISSITADTPVVLNAGTTKTVICNVTVTDGNGADDITGANATFFTSPSVAGSPDSNISHYKNSSCTVLGQSGSDKDYECSAQLYYYAYNGTWTCSATGISVDGTDTDITTFVVDPLYAINVSDTLIDFGEVQGGKFSQNISETLFNIGNQPINVTVSGYGGIPNDGWGFVCVTQNVSIDNIRHSSLFLADWSAKKQLESPLRGLNMTIAQQINASLTSNISYWQTFIPYTISDIAVCTGTIVFQAEQFV